MPDTQPTDDEPARTPKAQFLSDLWDRLERAMEVSTSRHVLSRLDELQRLCEEAADLIRRWRSA